MSAFAMWSSQATSTALRNFVAAQRLSDHYAQAAAAVNLEESLERKYRLEPSPEVLYRYRTAAGDLVAAMELVRRDGSAADRALVTEVLTTHDAYLAAIEQMFAAVDRHDIAAATAIDGAGVDPRFTTIEHDVIFASDSHRTVAQNRLDDQRRLQSFAERATPVVFASGLLLILGFISVLYRIRRQLQSQRRRALHDSLHDPLTGLANRVLLTKRLERAVRDGGDDALTGLLLLDVDRFKEVNYALGHAVGDQLLVQVGPRLIEVLRTDDTVARLGGDEFAILLPTVASLDAAMTAAERVRHAMSKPFTVNDLDLEVEVSVGVVVSQVHGVDVATLLQRADIAKHVAKTREVGVFAYDPEADHHSVEQLTLLTELRRALDQGELVVHYQPKIGVRHGELRGVEALVRWQHPDRGLLPPNEFIPLAEHTALIGPLTEYVLDAALAQAAFWLQAGYRIPVAVNLAARNLLDDRLPDTVAGLLFRHGVTADLLEVEVTESAIVTEPVRARRVLARLATVGVGIAIDDFGVGYTSLAELRTLPVTSLKIDRSFVTTLCTDSTNGHIVQSIVDLGRSLGLITVAEGVEDEAALAELRRMGCELAQGFLFSRPVPAAALTSWYLDRIADARSTTGQRAQGRR